MEQRFEYRGDLAVTPLPELLATIHRYRVPGEVVARRGKDERRILIEGGNVVFARSNDIEDSLGRFLVRRRMMTEETYAESVERLVRGGKRQGEILIDMKVLTPQQLREAVVDQVRSILWGVFEWESGEAVFSVPPPPYHETIKIRVSIPRCILEGVCRVADARRWVKRLGPSWTVLERVAEVSTEEMLTPEEAAYLEKVDAKLPLVELLKRGPGKPPDNARILYGFSCLGLVRQRPQEKAKKFQWRTSGGSIGKQ